MDCPYSSLQFITTTHRNGSLCSVVKSKQSSRDHSDVEYADFLTALLIKHNALQKYKNTSNTTMVDNFKPILLSYRT